MHCTGRASHVHLFENNIFYMLHCILSAGRNSINLQIHTENVVLFAQVHYDDSMLNKLLALSSFIF